jgi:hypothetical protein
MPGIGTSIFLIAVGAVLKYAINTDEPDWIDINVVGTILLLIGILGLALSLVWMFVWSNRGGGRDAYEEPPPRDRYGAPPRY